MRNLTCLLLVLVPACKDTETAADVDASAPSVDGAPGAPDAAPAEVLPSLTFCRVADPANPGAAFASTTDGVWVNYTCAEACPDWTACTYGVLDASAAPIRSARGNLPIQGLAFVVDGMAGHFAFTSDGNDVVVTHAGSGGTSTFNTFDRALQSISDLKTVSLGWERGTPVIFGGGGWFTRKDAQPSSTRAQAVRPAAAIQWVKDHLAVGHKLGTVGASMGTMATFGAHVWYGLEPIIDYQMLIGGPGYWDVNAGCGRVHIGAGFCDTDVSACTGNPRSSYGDNDPTCGTATDSCRVPTIMAPLEGGGSAYDACINYVGATTACAPTTGDSRDPALDASSLAFTVDSWDFHGRIDFIANEGGVQPPNADQGMGEGHMMYIYQQIQSARGWIDNEGAHHGDAWSHDPVLVAAAARAVVAGMGD